MTIKSIAEAAQNYKEAVKARVEAFAKVRAVEEHFEAMHRQWKAAETSENTALRELRTAVMGKEEA
jgi:hypothetical protein